MQPMQFKFCFSFDIFSISLVLKFLVTALAMPLSAFAQKSTNDCEAELDQKYGLGSYSRSEISNCLFESITTPEEREKANRKVAREEGVYILDFGVLQVNSAGGVEPYVVVINPKKTSAVKYIQMDITLYNNVGDIVTDEITGRSRGRILYTGPLNYESGEYHAGWKPVWYNYSGACIKINSIQVTHLNGGILRFSGKKLDLALSKSIDNKCGVIQQK